MFGKKDRENSKGSRCSQRKPSANATPKSNPIQPQVGKQKLTKLLQPSTPSEKAKLKTDTNEKVVGYLSSNSKRKNSSNSTVNKKQTPEHRTSIANSSKQAVKLSPTTASTINYIHAKTTYDIKKEILNNKLSSGVSAKKYKSLEDHHTLQPVSIINNKTNISKGSNDNTTLLSHLITQVSYNSAGGSSNQNINHNGSNSSTSQNKDNLKKKKKSTIATSNTVLQSSKNQLSHILPIKNERVFYMQKLEMAFKECGEDEQSILFRQHFKQTIQTLSMLSNISESVRPFTEAQRVALPPLADPSTLFSLRPEDYSLRSR